MSLAFCPVLPVIASRNPVLHTRLEVEWMDGYLNLQRCDRAKFP